MRDVTSTMQYVFAAMGGAIGAVLGGFDGFLYALIVFVAVDYVTGVMVGILNKELSSRIGFRGISILGRERGYCLCPVLPGNEEL